MSGNLVNVRPKPGFVMDSGGAIIPARGNANPLALMMMDRLSNLVTGQGTSIDRSVYGGYSLGIVNPAQVEASYRSSWLMRKIVDLPPLDMTRNWRAWQADDDKIETIEAEEKRLRLKHKAKRALTLARLWGGGVILMGVKGTIDPMEELRPETVKQGDLEYLHVFAPSQIAPGTMIADPASPWFGEPDRWTINTGNGRQLDIHPSRAVPFVGQPAPEGSTMQNGVWFWGDPLYQSILSAIQNADLAQDGFAALIAEAKTDVINVPDLMTNIASDEYTQRMLDRLALANSAKSIWRALLLDGEETWQQRQITWTGIPETMAAFLQVVSGAADIPITRMLGQSPKGLQSTGEGEEKDYHASIEARQDEMLWPQIDRIDAIMIRSALGEWPKELWYRPNPLVRLTPKEAAEVENKRANTVKIYSDTGLIEPPALATIAKNAITESGQWPGSDEAFAEFEADWEQEGKPSAPENDNDANAELLLPEERDARDRRRPRRIMDRQIDDARPRSLYVSRKLINAADLIRWAKAQGFTTTQPAEEMHVTLAFSRKPVDWMAVGDDWSSDEDGKIRVKPGGPRTVEPLGDKGAVVLMFRNDALEWRHRRIHEESTGAQWDFPEYQPHVTITWQAPDDLDLAKVEPYQGPLVFGPERFAEVVDDWEKTIEES